MIAHEKAAGMLETSATAQKTTHRDFTPSRLCDTFKLGARHTTSEAVYLPVSKVFSCPKFKVLDVGNVYPQGRRHRFGDVSTPHVHLVDLDSQQMVSEFPEGIKTMTHVNTPTTPNAAPLGTTPTSSIARQQAIENALSLALFHIRKGDTQKAVAKSIRATSLLKQSCSDLFIGSV